MAVAERTVSGQGDAAVGRAGDRGGAHRQGVAVGVGVIGQKRGLARVEHGDRAALGDGGLVVLSLGRPVEEEAVESDLRPVFHQHVFAQEGAKGLGAVAQPQRAVRGVEAGRHQVGGADLGGAGCRSQRPILAVDAGDVEHQLVGGDARAALRADQGTLAGGEAVFDPHLAARREEQLGAGAAGERAQVVDAAREHQRADVADRDVAVVARRQNRQSAPSDHHIRSAGWGRRRDEGGRVEKTGSGSGVIRAPPIAPWFKSLLYDTSPPIVALFLILTESAARLEGETVDRTDPERAPNPLAVSGRGWRR